MPQGALRLGHPVLPEMPDGWEDQGGQAVKRSYLRDPDIQRRPFDAKRYKELAQQIRETMPHGLADSNQWNQAGIEQKLEMLRDYILDQEAKQ